MKTPDYTEYVESVGGEVRYYQTGDTWRYVCAMGEGSDLPSLQAAQAEVDAMAMKTPNSKWGNPEWVRRIAFDDLDRRYTALAEENAILREALKACVISLSRYPSYDPNGEVWGDMVPDTARAALALQQNGGKA